jgi:NAD(P)-dependent dehydrogenase (short-subunit alcohol dehydrogenase family)
MTPFLEVELFSCRAFALTDTRILTLQVAISSADTRQPNGLASFYNRAAAESSRIDLCIHCLGMERVGSAEERLKSDLDARTVFMGTLLAARHLQTKEGVGTILNLALVETPGSNDPDMVRAARELVVGITRYAAEIAPLKVRAFAVLPAKTAPLTLLCSGSDPATRQICLSKLKVDYLSRKVLQLVRRLAAPTAPVLQATC